MRFTDFLSDLLDFAKRDSEGNIVLPGGAEATAGRKLNVEELALFCVIDLIASAGALCEWRTYHAGTRSTGADWYSWNVSANLNQSAAEFKRLLLARLLRFGEALVFGHQGGYYIADSFVREEYAFRPSVYSGITCRGLSLRSELPEQEVFYFRLPGNPGAMLMRGVQKLYSEAMTEAWSKYQHSGSRSGIVEISTQARSRPTFEKDIETLMNDRFRTFFERKNAVLPLFEGFKYIPQNGPAAQKNTSEVSDLESLFRQAQDRACNVYHVPPSLLRGDVTNQDDAVNAMLSFALKPALTAIQTEVNRKSYGTSVLGGWYMRIDMTHVKTVDVFAVAEKVDKLVQDSIYSPNDIREKLDDEPIPEPWADEYTRTKNMEAVPHGKGGE